MSETPDGAASAGAAPQNGAPGGGAPDSDVVELATKVFDLARRGEAETLAAYVDAGVPVNLTNDRGDSLVMLAAYHGHAPAVTALLSRGAEADRPNDRGQTPLAGAVFKGEDDVIRALLTGGADPTAGTPSAVDTARMFGKTDLLELFAAR
ncbi:ankyrin repeat domain-containing protein [Streptomyces sp. NBC_01725]|uniref:ankyrin repeat domain-containing protein n=1 Tax=unclassified Streptomyces TaxID=2593676 RepID=UPI0011C8DC78|nr:MULTISPECIES: ankyrin repeat domain-containing protein [unclassified Streptomyces]TXL85958.1 ankyrin repeat domain-containing protein [Streptomyces sp. IB2014 016-6]